MRFENKVVIVTGAGSGLGQAASLQLASENAKLVLVDLNEAGLKETEEKVLALAPQAEILLVTANVADDARCKRLCRCNG